jgi:hypothetical protein
MNVRIAVDQAMNFGVEDIPSQLEVKISIMVATGNFI